MPLPIVLAFGFANSLLLWGATAASLPIIIHLLNRRRFREEHWAAMRFLLAALRKNQRRIKLEQWLLLAIRTLIILLVVGAMAKPYLESVGAMPVLAGKRTHRVIVLDGSMSMAYAPAETSRFDQAKDLAAQIVRKARRGDAISLVVMADPPRVVIGAPSPNHDEVLKELADVTLTHGGTDLTASLRAVDRVLESSSIPQKEVVFLTDLQRASWQAPGGSGDALKRAIAALEARRPRAVVVDLGATGATNRAVTSLALDAPIVTPGASVLATAVVRNFGPEAARSAPVRLIVDGRVGPVREVDLPVGEDVPVPFAYSFPSAGEHLIEARIGEDPLALDNRRRLAVPVREALDVLLVDGDPHSEPFRSETDLLAEALSPEPESPGNPSPVRVSVAPGSQLTRRDLSAFDVVALCNVPRFSESEVAALEAFLKQGGGLVFFGGDQVATENYNNLLFADGKGLLPAALGATAGDPQKGSAFRIDPLGYRHPIVAAFGGAAAPVQASVTNVKVFRYHTLSIPDGSPARVALAINGDPLIVEAPRHRGKVVLVATTADQDWNDWSIHKSFPPVMEQVVDQAAAGRLAARNVRVGQPLDGAFPPGGAAAEASVTRPDGRNTPVKLRPDGDVSRLSFDETDLSGVYRVAVGPPVKVDALYAANPDPAESDPAKLDRRGLQAALPGLSFDYRSDWQGLIADPASVSRRGELHRSLLWAVLGLLLVESFLAWRFGHHR